jgi:6-pyruvoyltetrahydropterin/6-carboxytetrahydropterin synthase
MKTVYGSTKTYTHAQGLSVAFRQWRAESHCRFIHGYAIQVELSFEASQLDERNWVQDFGGLKEIKQWLEGTFDHKLVVAADDPELKTFEILSMQGLAQLVVLEEGVGCEMFAEHIFKHVSNWLWQEQDRTAIPRVRLVKCEVREHGGNSAYIRTDK